MTTGSAEAGEGDDMDAAETDATDSISLDAVVLPAFVKPEGSIDELQPWLDRRDLEHQIALAPEGADYHSPLYHDGSLGAVATGIGPTAAATTVSALLATPAVDCANALFVTAGIAGGPPDRATLGSTFVHDAVVDWDAKHRFPPDGLDDGERAVALQEFRPRDYVYELNEDLVARAAAVAEDVDLLDWGFASEVDEKYPDRSGPAAPGVGRGTTVAGAEFWHGEGVADDVEWLCEQYGAGPYVTTESEDAGTAHALARHGALDRYLSVRSIANFDRPPAGAAPTAVTDEWNEAMPMAVENAYRVASAVVEDRLSDPAGWQSLL